jgi:hypothetical protein
MGMYCLVWLQNVEPLKVVYVQDMSIEGLACCSCILEVFRIPRSVSVKTPCHASRCLEKYLCAMSTMQVVNAVIQKVYDFVHTPFPQMKILGVPAQQSRSLIQRD